MGGGGDVERDAAAVYRVNAHGDAVGEGAQVNVYIRPGADLRRAKGRRLVEQRVLGVELEYVALHTGRTMRSVLIVNSMDEGMLREGDLDVVVVVMVVVMANIG